MESWGYERKPLKNIWMNVVEVLMCYVTLEGKFNTIFGHHFTLLNHFRHGLFISFLFSLLSSMEVSIYANLMNRRAPILHEGLILLIMENVKALLLVPAISNKEKIMSDVYRVCLAWILVLQMKKNGLKRKMFPCLVRLIP